MLSNVESVLVILGLSGGGRAAEQLLGAPQLSSERGDHLSSVNRACVEAGRSRTGGGPEVGWSLQFLEVWAGRAQAVILSEWEMVGFEEGNGLP